MDCLRSEIKEYENTHSIGFDQSTLNINYRKLTRNEINFKIRVGCWEYMIQNCNDQPFLDFIADIKAAGINISNVPFFMATAFHLLSLRIKNLSYDDDIEKEIKHIRLTKITEVNNLLMVFMKRLDLEGPFIEYVDKNVDT